MDNFLNWYSVEKDGLPEKDGMYLTVAKYKQVVGYITMIEKTWYNKGAKRWEDASDLDENYFISRDRKVNYFVTHYIPISEIPIPE
ncbi:hypothetical protein BGI36_07255 [Snodgrassella communis]|uniref:hypothetical protein n=1 Tax=Snodgrassella communis TaxID=2946699 RepID=UPI000C1F89CE|nr:hypothetical protein [Snodgrassella communis]PIT20886.1 hypothetical protein BGI36_07255 [Snodgrassella communis]